MLVLYLGVVVLATGLKYRVKSQINILDGDTLSAIDIKKSPFVQPTKIFEMLTLLILPAELL